MVLAELRKEVMLLNLQALPTLYLTRSCFFDDRSFFTTYLLIKRYVSLYWVNQGYLLSFTRATCSRPLKQSTRLSPRYVR